MINVFQKIGLFLVNIYPVALAPERRTDLTPAEQKKFQQIRQIVVEVGRKVGVKDPESVDFRITRKFDLNACMVGSVASFSGPVMCLANDYFTAFQSPKILNDPAYAIWKRCLDELPDDPMQMAEVLARCSPQMRRRIRDLAIEYRAVITPEELKGVVAHEFGHAKHLHSWKQLFFMIPMAAGAVMAKEVGATYLGNTSSHLAALAVFSLGMHQVSQIFEREADEATAVSRTYSLGIASFFKKHLLVELAGEEDSRRLMKRAKQMIEGVDFETHPHPAKRVIAALNRKERPAQEISIWEKGIAFLGGAFLAHEIAVSAAKVWAALFGKKKQNP